MSSEEWLNQVGSEYLAQVQAEEPQFLIEVDVPDARLNELFAHISKAWPSRWTPQKRVCLALAAVHSAARADEYEDSFRKVFYARLGREFNQAEWENLYGSYLSAFLRDWFPVELPASGPYRYVGAVYRHAGIPVPARAGFCQLLGDLLRDGLAFTRSQYADAVQKVPSSVARCFLESEAGYDFTKQTARLIVRLDEGQISRKELETFPPYRRSLYEAALSEVHRVPSGRNRVPSDSYPAPVLALDIATRRLVIRFDAKGVAANVYRTTKGVVYYATQAVFGTEPPRYCIKPETEWTSISPWWSPGQSQYALFRSGDGAIIDFSGAVAAGRYYLVTSVPEAIPGELILEEGVYLENDEADALGVYYSIVLIELPRGLEIPELSIRVRGSATPPSLEFVNAEHLSHALGAEVFVDQLPSLRVRNWTAECQDKYWLWINDGSGERRLNPAPDGRLPVIQVPCPSQGSICLEPKHSTRDTSSTQRLTYTVVPKGIEIRVVEPCSGLAEPAHGVVQLPTGWTFEPLCALHKDSSGLLTIPGGERLLEGTLSSREIRVSVSLRVPRAAIRFQSCRGSGAVLWREDIAERLPILIEGLPNRRCLILLESDHGTEIVCDLGELDRSGQKRTVLALFKDALATSRMAAAEFQLQLGESLPVPTRHYFASAERIAGDLSTEAPDSILFRLPDVGAALSEARQLIDGPLVSFSVPAELDVPESLRSFLCGVAVGATAFDGTTLKDEIDAYHKQAPPFIRSVVEWLREAQIASSALGTEQQVLAAYPAADADLLPVPRWREMLRRATRQIQINQDLPELLHKWHQAIENPAREPESELFARRGGRDFTEAVRRYNDSFSEQGKARNEILTRSIIALRRTVERSDVDPIIRLIAPAFLQLAYHHSDRLHDAAMIEIPTFPFVLERLGKAMLALAAHCKGEARCSITGEGIGFAELSTRKEDSILQLELEKSVLVAKSL